MSLAPSVVVGFTQIFHQQAVRANIASECPRFEIGTGGDFRRRNWLHMRTRLDPFGYAVVKRSAVDETSIQRRIDDNLVFQQRQCVWNRGRQNFSGLDTSSPLAAKVIEFGSATRAL